MSGPCDWDFDSGCCPNWDEYPPAVKQAATDYATLVLWAATGRRYGLCEMTVRPCGRAKGHGMPGWGWGSYWLGGVWYPYIGSDGAWRNCGCHGFCNCTPNCEAYLPGPVNSIVEVVVAGEVVDPENYEVQDRTWLVRLDGECWPECPDMAAEEAFEVTYLRGEPVPAALVGATGVLACQFAKACAGEPCQLPGRLQFITRQGVTAQMVDVERLLERNLTGIQEVDQVIASLNPNRLHGRPRVMSPDRPTVRTVTTPAQMSSS
jgi:hypothetical protein